MPSEYFTIADEIEKANFNRPHVVILGAGASLAALPKGDRNGRRLPVIKNFVDVLGLASLLAENGVAAPYDDFEGLYSDIAQDVSKAELRTAIEQRVHDYFAGLQLPDTPTLYDHLILSLRPKDFIATFNWDPFLWLAGTCNYKFGGVPTLLFLHGNVAIGYCGDCQVVRRRGGNCRCGKLVSPSPLLYPIKHKNYQSDLAIAEDWRALKSALKAAWTVTFFGYGAPKTDVEAIQLLKDGWGRVETRNLEQTEIIDIRSEDDLLNTWNPFIHTHHYTIRRSFYDSNIAKHPRRSCEALWQRLMENQHFEGSTFPTAASFSELYRWLETRVQAEKESTQADEADRHSTEG